MTDLTWPSDLHRDQPRRVLVTGAEQEEGARAARILAEQGFSVIVHSFSPQHGERVAADLVAAGGDAVPITADLTLDRDVADLFDRIDRSHGDLHAVVHTAWLPGPESTTGGLSAIDHRDWNRFVCNHLALSFLMFTHALRSLGSHGRGGAFIAVTGLGDSLHSAQSGAPARATVDGAVEALATVAASEYHRASVHIDAIRLHHDSTQAAGRDFASLLLELVDPERNSPSERVCQTQPRPGVLVG